MENCAFTDTVAEHLLCASTPQSEDAYVPEDEGFHPFFSDKNVAVWNQEGSKTYGDDSNSLEEVPDDAGFLGATDPHFLAIQQVCLQILADLADSFRHAAVGVLRVCKNMVRVRKGCLEH